MIICSEIEAGAVAVGLYGAFKDLAIGKEDRATLDDGRFVFREHVLDHVANLSERKVQNSAIEAYHYKMGFDNDRLNQVREYKFKYTI